MSHTTFMCRLCFKDRPHYEGRYDRLVGHACKYCIEERTGVTEEERRKRFLGSSIAARGELEG